MIKYAIGEIIKRERKSQNITQEELAECICTPSWLSKIESGTCIPSIAMFESIMQKLGKSASPFIQYKSEVEIETEQLKYMTRRYYSLNEIILAKESFEKLKNLDRVDRTFDKQFIMLYKLLLANNDFELDFQKKYLMQALNYSIPNFKIVNINKYLLNQDEIIIIYKLILIMIDQGDIRALESLKKLKTYLENPKFDYEEKIRTYPLILCSLARLQAANSDYLGCLSTCETAINFSIQYNTLSLLPNILYFKGCSLVELGSNKLAEKNIRLSYSLFDILNEKENVEKVRQYAFEKLLIDFET